jgi:hypothetical protein
MTASDWNWLLTIVGVFASIVGVVFSWLAWVQAKGAKKAAEEAARAVRTHETAYDFSKMAADAKSLLEAVQTRQKDKAIAAATELAHLLMIAKDRRADFLPTAFSSELCVQNLHGIGTKLAAEGLPESQQKMTALLGQCNQIHKSLCEMAGSVDRNSEGTER